MRDFEFESRVMFIHEECMPIYLNEYDVYFLIDFEDYEKIKIYDWRVLHSKDHPPTIVASLCKSNEVQVLMLSRLICGLTPDDEEQVFHKNRDPFDFRKSNLVTLLPNDLKKLRATNKNNTSGYKGVFFRKDNGRYRSIIQYNRKRYELGNFKSPEEAAREYDRYARKFYGELAYVNFPEIKELQLKFFHPKKPLVDPIRRKFVIEQNHIM